MSTSEELSSDESDIRDRNKYYNSEQVSFLCLSFLLTHIRDVHKETFFFKIVLSTRYKA